MGPLFGQLQVISCPSCPNGPSIRTTTGYFLPELSEWALYSDNYWLFLARAVRISPLFGQLLAISCPSCPNQSSIRTTTGYFLPELSEWAFHSDNYWLFLAQAVRISPLFGQLQ